jgi:hypothetical protein
MTTSLSPTRAPINATNVTADVIKQGRKYGWSRRYANFPKVSGQRSAGLENTPPMIGLECRQWNRSYSNNQSTLPNCSAYTVRNGYIRKRICDICFVRDLECCQTLIIRDRCTRLANHGFCDT